MAKQQHPTSTCGHCGVHDDHPKLQVLVGFNNPNTGGAMFHEHDDDRDGVINYHFHCPSEWHAKVHPDVAEQHARIVALAQSGVRGDDLRARIMAGDV